MAFQAALAVLFLCVATAKDTGMVTFSGAEFEMTCPLEGTWHKNGKEVGRNMDSYKNTYKSETRGLYHCTYKEPDGDKDVKYYFYVKGKACANCVELDGLTFLLAITVDVVATMTLMIFIYKCTKNKSSAKPTQTPKLPARSGGHAPPSTSSPYEQLNPRTRSDDPYSVVNRMG
ncbi:T-cell surface glycoprotein CD3 epsilon chain-like [Solea solea]|uniref:T-cell surface glycoprotein CD3 epsilon chain-like n=1 Tax=Solea solea TaxID=90069 RepID=UPI002729722C|nr:T-cell surface glycoprotein CD3 epsilon chain-like [Solea solea]